MVVQGRKNQIGMEEVIVVIEGRWRKVQMKEDIRSMKNMVE